MKKALITVLVLMAAATTTTPLLAAPASPAAMSTGTFDTQARRETAALRRQMQSTSPTQAPIAQSPSLTRTEEITTTPAITATMVQTGLLAPVAGMTVTTDLAAPAPIVAASTLTATEELTQAETAAAALSPEELAALDDAYGEVLEGTIIANRSDTAIRFFVEGKTFEVAPLRSISLDLARDTAVLNLFNCEASKTDADAGCFWDPYLLTRDGFYEVVIGQQLGGDILLSLRAAGAPPGNQIWIQNRTGERETVIVNNELIEIPPASVKEFTVATDAPVIVQLRACIQNGTQSVCEWAPQAADAGFYYGLVRNETPGPNNTLLTTLALQGVVASDGETVKPPPQAFCRLRVPTLNVRSGPGLEFPIIAKIRGTETEPGSVVVIAFDATQTWMQVTERVARDGWVTANPEFILCEGALAELPVIGQPVAADAPPAPAETTVAPSAPVETEPVVEAVTPEVAATEASAPAPDAAPVEEPVADVPADAAPAEEVPADAVPAEEATPTPQTPEVPEGLARIVVHNPFDQVMRFTLDQKYRPERENLSGEWDLQPGDSISILVYPGTIAFTASTPWRSLSDNAEFVISEREERELWLWFVPDPVEPDQWNLQF